MIWDSSFMLATEPSREAESFVEKYIVPVVFVWYALIKNSNLYRYFLFTVSQFIFNTWCTAPSNFLFSQFCILCCDRFSNQNIISFWNLKNNIIVPRLGDKYIFSQVCYQTSLRTYVIHIWAGLSLFIIYWKSALRFNKYGTITVCFPSICKFFKRSFYLILPVLSVKCRQSSTLNPE